MLKENDILADFIDKMIENPKTAQLPDGQMPGEYQRLAEGLVRIQTILSSMTHHAEQIMNGDYAQEQEKECEIPGVFEKMIHELRRRTSALENERNLFIQFTESASERIVVLDEETGDFLFGNKIARTFYEENMHNMDNAEKLNAMSKCSEQCPYSQWLHTVTIPAGDGKTVVQYYQVHSLYIIWENRGAIAHMFSDVTEVQNVRDMAMRDVLTGVYNRRYAMEYMNECAENNKDFALGFVDVDYLKYCNDEYGHYAGDLYLVQVVGVLQKIAGEKIVCRTGGDEFVVISQELSEEGLRQELERARRELSEQKFDNAKSIYKSFSYGLAFRDKDCAQTLHEILALADERMYVNKLENKKKNHLIVCDDRLI